MIGALDLRAFYALMTFDLSLKRTTFVSLCSRVREVPIHVPRSTIAVEEICDSINFASTWYWKHVLCLQRSAATTALLRENGIAAKMILGAQHTPFKAHAWVEVDDVIVNDRPYVREIYTEFERM